MSRSNGLAKRASAIVGVMPFAASASQAASTSCRRVPNERIATPLPSRIIRPLPISKTSGIVGISTPTPSPRGKRNAIGPASCAAAVATMRTNSASSAAAITTKPGRLARKATSNAPACVAPSAPTSPARSIAKRTGNLWIATSCTIWS